MVEPARTALGAPDDDLDVDPRILRTRRVVLAATIDLVADQGCDGASIDAISERAQVSRTTIYRHWPQRSQLLLDALRALVEPQPDFDTGSLRTDLVELLSWINDFLGASKFGVALASLVEAARREPPLAEALDRFLDERRRHGRDIFRRAIDRGELPAGTDIETPLVVVTSPVFYSTLVRRKPLTRAEVVRYVEWVLTPALQPSTKP